MSQPQKEVKKSNFNEENLSSEIKIPISVLSNRSLATLESVVVYLKENLNLTYHQIAELLNRDDRTIWTCYNRASKKREK
ncbi:MAG: hypothetical protein AABW88_05230 [Nanoarchaeota archaeon]